MYFILCLLLINNLIKMYILYFDLTTIHYFKGILERYKLSYHFDDTVNEPQIINHTHFETQDRVSEDSSKVVDKYLLHDKRLNQLWEQAKQSGFTSNIINNY